MLTWTPTQTGHDPWEQVWVQVTGHRVTGTVLSWVKPSTLVHTTQTVDSNAATCWCMPHRVLMQMLQHAAACHTNCWCKHCNMLLHATQTVDANAATHWCMPHKWLIQMLKHAAARHTNGWCKCCNTLLHATQTVDANAATHCCMPHKLLMQMLQHTGVHHTNCWFKCCNMLLHHAQSVDARVKGWNKDMICIKKKFSREGLHYHLKVHFFKYLAFF